MANDERTTTGVGKVLRDVIKRIDPEQRLGAFEVWNFWDDAVGVALARRARPSAYRNGVLIVTVSAHAWMQELQFMKDTLRDNLNARLGSDMIRDIYFVSGVVDAANTTPSDATKDDARELATTAPPVALPNIADPDLAAVFRRLVEAQARRRRRPSGETRKPRNR